jgi:hypothetical protein
MNERLQELHGQAYLYALHNETKAREEGSHEPGTFDNDYREKFAELIVKECAQFVEDKFDFCGDEIIIAEEVRKHFGVEE